MTLGPKPGFAPGKGLHHDWCNTAGVDTHFIDPGSPWQNGFIESFNAQFRREQLSEEIMDTMVEAKYLAEEWKAIYSQAEIIYSITADEPDTPPPPLDQPHPGQAAHVTVGSVPPVPRVCCIQTRTAHL